MSSPSITFHLIANSHLDPVWLWDWREGINEGLITIRTVLDLMDEFPELTYIRGETAIYEHVRRYDPAAFTRIKLLIRAGRWDYVGGTYIQPDTNMTGTETMARHFMTGQRYFTTHFGKPVQVAWAADSFGHSAGMPAILQQAGIRYFAFFRPSENLFHLDSPAFWWKGQDGSRILSYRPFVGWYGMERDEMPRRLDQYQKEANNHRHRNVAVFYGLGNHGGGPSRRQVLDIAKWSREHPEVQVLHSGLHRFFSALEKEIEPSDPLPEVTGEMNFFARGCYSAAAKFKFKYRKAEAGLIRAEKTASMISAGLNTSRPDLSESWRGLLFNSFHDILPGSSIERAMDEQVSWVEAIIHSNQKTEFEALNILAALIHTLRPPSRADHPEAVILLVWNPHPYPYRGPLELEAALDYRPLWPYHHRPGEVPLEVRDAKGKSVFFQEIAPEYYFMRRLPWRKRVLIDAKVPALGWTTYTLGWVEGAKAARFKGRPASSTSADEISAGPYQLRVKKGEAGLQIKVNDQSLFSGPGFGVQTLHDPWGPWGNHYEEPEAEDISTVLETWKVTDAEILEKGPLRSTMWIRFQDSSSRADFTFHLYHDQDLIEVDTRIFWDRPAARLKLVMPGVGRQAEYEVLGGTVLRGALKEVPGGRWVRVFGPKRTFGFASDAIYNYDLKDDTLRVTVVRSSRYTSDVPETAETPKHWPVIDKGEYRFKFRLTTAMSALPRLAQELESPPIVLPIPAKKGELPRAGSFVRLGNANLQLLALKPSEAGKDWIIRLQELTGKKTKPRLDWLGTSLTLPAMEKHSIGTYRISRTGKGWSAIRVVLDET